MPREGCCSYICRLWQPPPDSYPDRSDICPAETCRACLRKCPLPQEIRKNASVAAAMINVPNRPTLLTGKDQTWTQRYLIRFLKSPFKKRSRTSTSKLTTPLSSGEE